GALGDNTLVLKKVPTDVSGLTSGVTAISAGGQHTCALLGTSGIKCWGDNTFGEITDDGLYGFRPFPGLVEGPGAGPPVLMTVVSRKTHGAAGTFNQPLSFTPFDPPTESRASGGAHKIVFVFDKNVVSGSVAIGEGTATAAPATFNGSEMIVDLTGVNN